MPLPFFSLFRPDVWTDVRHQADIGNPSGQYLHAIVCRLEAESGGHYVMMSDCE